MNKFKPIKQTRASEEVLVQLKEAILRGHYKFGDKLPSERELTEQFQVSRGVVREAIRVLQINGFVVIRQGPTGGAYVAEWAFDQLSSGFMDLYLSGRLTIPELNQVRLHIEPEVARLAALNVTDAFRQRLKEDLAAEREPTTFRADYRQRLTRVHFTLLEMCGNYLFEAIVNSMISLTHRIVAAIEPEDHNSLHPVGEHDLIVEAVLAGEADRAAQEMRSHLETFFHRMHDIDEAFRLSPAMVSTVFQQR